MTDGTIRLAHGGGGALMRELLEREILPLFGGGEPRPPLDAAVCGEGAGRLAFTTDGFVVRPLEFPGGDIGTLAACGTLNDLAVMGATPLFLSCGLVVEEGFALERLRRILRSLADAARAAGAAVVTGDTKVVERGAADGLFITTSGVGRFEGRPFTDRLRPGDRLLVSGPVGDHGAAITAARPELGITSPVRSDCACVLALARAAAAACPDLRRMRDPTRGGLATVLLEFAAEDGVAVEVEEAAVPVREEVRGMCEILGFDPLYLACEGRVVLAVPEAGAAAALAALRGLPEGREAAVIGRVSAGPPGRVTLRTGLGGGRVLRELVEDMLPRIC